MVQVWNLHISSQLDVNMKENAIYLNVISFDVFFCVKYEYFAWAETMGRLLVLLIMGKCYISSVHTAEYSIYQ